MLSKFKKSFGSKPIIHQPIFIVGCGRSGTTLLFDILSSHPELARTTGYPDGEDHEGWIRHGGCVMAGIGNIHHSKYDNGINGQQYCLHMTKIDLNENIISNMRDYYWNDVLLKNSKLRVINKQPHLSNKLDYVLGIFPDAKFIHVVRDCEPMVASWLAVMDSHPSLVIYWPRSEELPCLWLMPRPDDPAALAKIASHPDFFPGGGAELFIDYWNKVNVGILKQMEGRESQLLSIRYEDLICNSTQVLERILDFCELSPFMFNIDNLQPNTRQKHSHRMTPELRAAIANCTYHTRPKFGYGEFSDN